MHSIKRIALRNERRFFDHLIKFIQNRMMWNKCCLKQESHTNIMYVYQYQILYDITYAITGALIEKVNNLLLFQFSSNRVTGINAQAYIYVQKVNDDTYRGTASSLNFLSYPIHIYLNILLWLGSTKPFVACIIRDLYQTSNTR